MPKVVVLGLDGVPLEMLRQWGVSGKYPHFRELLEAGVLFPLRSVQPPVSTVAWATFATGVNPGKHGVFGFIERRLNPFGFYIPTARQLRAPALWDHLGDHGLRSVVINLPLTYPPRPVQGVMISGFLATSLEKAVYPPELARTLREIGYAIDVDPWRAREDREGFFSDLIRALEKRFEAAFLLLKRERWDFFMLHVMETDRLLHFASRDLHTPEIEAFLRRLGDLVGELVRRIPEEAHFFMLSDHGFCPIRQEVFPNRWLLEKGYLKLRREPPRGPEDIHPETVAYSLPPGRFYVNLRGREAIGSVPPSRYEAVRERLMADLMETFRDPETGEPILAKVFRREELYHGPFAENGPDLLAQPRDGYDLKGNLYSERLTGRSHLSGMHTYEGAFLYLQGLEAPEPQSVPWLGDITATILKALGLPLPPNLDGRPLR